MKKKTIFFINNYSGAPSIGMRYRNYYFAQKLQEKYGHNILVITANKHHGLKQPITNTPNKIINVENVKYYPISTISYNSKIRRGINSIQYSLANPKKIVKAYGCIPDIVISSSPHPYTAIMGLRFKKIYKAKFIYEIRDPWPEALQDMANVKLYDPIYLSMKYCNNIAIKNADGIISVLPKALEYVKKYDNEFPENKFVYIPNPYHDNNKNLSVTSKVNEKILHLVYGGIIGKLNVLDMYIRAIALLPKKHRQNIVLDIFPYSWDEQILSNLKNLIHKLDLENVISFKTFLPRNKYLEILHQYSIGVMGWPQSELFNYGGSPSKLFEYMGNNLFVIHIGPDIDDIFKNSGGGINIDTYKISELKNILIILIESSKKDIEKKASNGKTYILKNYGIDKITEKFNSFIQNI